MQPFDDMLPEERAPQYEELITLLQQAYHSPMPVVTTKQAQILSRVQARLMETDPGTSLTEDMPVPANGRLAPPLSKPEGRAGKQRPGGQFFRLLNALAAVLVVGLIIASALVLFTHRSPKVGSSTRTVSAALPFQPLPSGCFFLPQQDSKQYCPHDPFTRLNISKDIPGYTITLKQAYADANQVLIEYTATKAANHQPADVYLGSFSTLRTQNGITLREGGSSGYSSVSVQIFNFEPATIMPTASTRTLSLHLIIHGMNAPVASSKPFRPVTFDFSLPFHSSRAVIMQQTVTVAGKSVTLTQGVATPSETRFYLYSRDVPLDQGNNFSLMDNGRNVNGIDGSVGGITNQDGYLTNPPNQPITTEIVDFEPLFESHAVGVLTVNAPPGSHAGPWTFHFTVQ